MIRPLGFFPELRPGWGLPLAEPIREAVRDAGELDESEVVAYLRAGREIFSVMGADWDVLASEDPVILTGIGSLYTDGEWLWREDLAYYASTYHLALPEEFLRRVREFAYQPPAVPDEQALDILRDLGVKLD